MPVTARVTLQKKKTHSSLKTEQDVHYDMNLSASTTYPACMLLWPERQQDAIADKDSKAPQDSKSQTYMTEVVVASSQQIPALKFLSRKALGHLIIHYALHTSPAEVEDVSHLKLRL